MRFRLSSNRRRLRFSDPRLADGVADNIAKFDRTKSEELSFGTRIWDWQLIGSIRRDCLNHVIVFNETHLRRTLAGYISYYHNARTHLALAKDAPTPRRVQAVAYGDVIAFPEVGGLHHRYERRAA